MICCIERTALASSLISLKMCQNDCSRPGTVDDFLNSLFVISKFEHYTVRTLIDPIIRVRTASSEHWRETHLH